MIEKIRRDNHDKAKDVASGEGGPDLPSRRTVVMSLAATLAALGLRPGSVEAEQKKAPPAKKAARRLERLPAGPRSLRDVLRSQVRANNAVVIDAKVAEEVRTIWSREYGGATGQRGSAFGKRLLDIVLGEQRMGPHIEPIKKIFKEESVPEWCMYLAIVESKFDVNLVSSAGAIGPFQFIDETAERYGLLEYDEKREHVIRDDRKDPLKSARACARHLKDNFLLYKSNNASDADAWRLAVHQYNGSFAYQYGRSLKRGSVPTYDGFLSYMQERMNKTLTRAQNARVHTLQRGETLGGVARRARVSLAALLSENPAIKNPNVVQPGTQIKIPALAEADASEYTVKAGDTLISIARHLGTDVKKLMELNALKNTVIRPGQKLKVPPDATYAAEIIVRNKVARLGGLVENLEYTLKLEGLLRALKARGTISQIPS